jgi:dCTP deaminase
MTLTKRDILSRLNRSTNEGVDPIIVTPILDIEDQVGIAGIDVRLGKQFILFKHQLAGSFSPLKAINDLDDMSAYQEEMVFPLRKRIVLHPGQLIIGSTWEYVCVPPSLECQVEGRSSWARLGLIVAAASTVEPGFKGMITLELSNTGTIPLELFPGLKVAQLVFHKCSETHKMSPDEEAKKKYQCSIGPGFSKLWKDKNLEYFCGGPNY